MNMTKYKVGYTAGVFDMFHIGHLNIFKNAKTLCEHLIVAVSTDQLVLEYKKHLPVIPFSERCEIVKSVRYVDEVVPQTDMDKVRSALKHHIDVMFVGSDWKGSAKWNKIERELSKIGVAVIYLPHTDGVSSTMIREKIAARNR